jgi:serine/threonine-protein kinase
VNIALQMASGLAATHAAGIVHRDLKPDNVFLIERGGRQDVVKLLDFGVAKLLTPNEGDIATYRTNDGIVVGTPDYMSPEQAAGKKVTHATDIYSLGVILYEMVAGQRPFQAQSFGELVIKHMTATPPRPRHFPALRFTVPPALEELILACLAKEPSQRPQDMKEVEASLQEVANRFASGETTFKEPRRLDRRAWLGMGAGLALLAGGAAAVMLPVPNKPHTARPAGVLTSTTTVARGAPAARVRVKISFGSDPPGALVFKAGAVEPLGVTPFVASFDASATMETFEFRVDGQAVARRVVSLRSDAQVEVALVPRAAAADSAGAQKAGSGGDSGQAGHGKRRHNKLDHSAVLDPFE